MQVTCDQGMSDTYACYYCYYDIIIYLNMFLCIRVCTCVHHIAEEIRFAVPSYTFIENEGTGSVVVNGTANFPSTLSVRIMGGLSERDCICKKLSFHSFYLNGLFT